MKTIFIILNIFLFLVIFSWIPVLYIYKIDLKIYASFVALFIQFIGVSVGLWLGYYYFENKKDFDSNLKRIEFQRKIINEIRTEINLISDIVIKILFNKMTESEFQIQRCKLILSLDITEGFFDGSSLLTIDKQEVIYFLNINQIIDKYIINSLTYKDLKKNLKTNNNTFDSFSLNFKMFNRILLTK